MQKITALLIFLTTSACMEGGGVATDPDEIVTAKTAAQVFANTCLAPPAKGQDLSTALGSSDAFQRAGRKGPGPKTVVYDGPNGMTGVRQMFVNDNGTKTASCAIYATVSDRENIHNEAENAVEQVFGFVTTSDKSGQAWSGTTFTPSGFVFEVVSSRLGDGSGLLYQPVGNVTLTIRQAPVKIEFHYN
ncbi:hypothetical protein ATO10_08217 [Actibacterium atlanticum]|uniref:Lipoprotein n=2 Tax=Actibacterium atlanticum TaxID=1461693 RepID=A0A058ZMA1_9RHOB|nr:hypothetical protein ATO10_08217 [Actibacterium atlanticum]